MFPSLCFAKDELFFEELMNKRFLGSKSFILSVKTVVFPVVFRSIFAEEKKLLNYELIICIFFNDHKKWIIQWRITQLLQTASCTYYEIVCNWDFDCILLFFVQLKVESWIIRVALHLFSHYNLLNVCFMATSPSIVLFFEGTAGNHLKKLPHTGCSITPLMNAMEKKYRK